MFKKKNQQKTQRDIVPQASAKVFSYYGNQPVAGKTTRNEHATSSAAHKLWVYLKHLPMYAALLGIVVSLVYVSLIDPNPRMVFSGATSSDNTASRGEDQYRNKVHSLITSSFWNKSKLTMNARRVDANIESAFPEVIAADTTIPILTRRPIVVLELSRPALVLSSNSGRYVLDTAGRAIMAVDEAGNVSADLPLVTDETNIPVEIGKPVLPATDITYIKTVHYQLTEQGIGVESFSLPAIARELNVRIVDHQYFVKFNLTQEPRQSAGAFVAVKQRLEAEGKVPAQYIDVRVEERAYYK